MTAYPELIYNKFAQRRILPEKNGDIIVFRRYNRLPTVPIPLVDGITPPGTPLSATDIKAQVSFYGNYVILTNQVQLIVEDQTVNESTVLLSQNMAQTMDEVTRDVLISTASVYQCSQGTNGLTPTNLSDPDIQAAYLTLLNNNALMISKVVTASTGFATASVRPAFFGFMDTSLLDDLESVASFQATNDYAHQTTVLDSEWGATKNVRWLQSSVGSVSSASPAVYNNIIVGQEAYAVVHLRAETGEFYIKPLGSAGAADPLNQRGSCGWQHPFVSRILNDAFLINLMATHS